MMAFTYRFSHSPFIVFVIMDIRTKHFYFYFYSPSTVSFLFTSIFSLPQQANQKVPEFIPLKCYLKVPFSSKISKHSSLTTKLILKAYLPMTYNTWVAFRGQRSNPSSYCLVISNLQEPFHLLLPHLN